MVAGEVRHHARGGSTMHMHLRWLLPPPATAAPGRTSLSLACSRPNGPSLSRPSSLPDDGQEREAGQDALRQLALRALQQRRPLAGSGSAATSIRRARHGAACPTDTEVAKQEHRRLPGLQRAANECGRWGFKRIGRPAEAFACRMVALLRMNCRAACAPRVVSRIPAARWRRRRAQSWDQSHGGPTPVPRPS